MTDGLENMFGDLNVVGGSLAPSGLDVPGTGDTPLGADANSYGVEETALQGGTALSSHTLVADEDGSWLDSETRTGGHSQTLEVAGTTQSSGGLMNQAAVTDAGLPADAAPPPGEMIVNQARRTAARTAVEQGWQAVQAMAVDRRNHEDDNIDEMHPPANRFDDAESTPLTGRCEPGFFDQRLNMTRDCLSGDETDPFVERPGTGTCDQSATVACLWQRCRFRQCAAQCQVTVCSPEPRCPRAWVCRTSGADGGAPGSSG